ncbi:MAG: haloacid dehalogenase-like hydrolase [Chloroflexota bacterium]|nr:haloacid dehalogenase-like hydrolase [Dehalococcoidia bacterium]MDW8046935.1 haloacid dehalogenase-like hydrolase [Chloroflexota bacterium]
MRGVAFFDIDLTLVNTNGAGRGAMRRAFEALGFDGELLVTLPIDGRTDRAIFLDALGRYGVPAGEREAALAAVVERYLALLPEELASRGGSVLTGARELVGVLAEEGWALGLATGNLRGGAEAKLTFFELWEPFAFGGFGDGATLREAVVVEAVAAAEAFLGKPVPRERAWVIGDTPLDIQAARAAGLRALGVATGNYGPTELAAAGADAVVRSLANLADVLAVLDP